MIRLEKKNNILKKKNRTKKCKLEMTHQTQFSSLLQGQNPKSWHIVLIRNKNSKTQMMFITLTNTFRKA